MIKHLNNGQHWRGGILALVLFLCAPLAALGLTPVPTSISLNAAAIVVDYGDGTYSYAWVPFEEEEISGFELLDRSGLDMLAVSFGGLGQGVCKIQRTGCDLDPCRATLCQSGDRSSPFWQYLQQDDAGSWVVAPLGASASKVHDGDVDGWAWTGQKPSTPTLTFDQVADLAGLTDESSEKAVHRSTGEPVSQDQAPDRNSLIAGTAVLVAVGILGSMLIVRSRRLRG